MIMIIYLLIINKTKVKTGRVLRMEYLGLENCPAHAIKHFLNKLAHMKLV